MFVWGRARGAAWTRAMQAAKERIFLKCIVNGGVEVAVSSCEIDR